MEVESNGREQGNKIVRKPYVVNGQCCSCAPQGAPQGALQHPQPRRVSCQATPLPLHFWGSPEALWVILCFWTVLNCCAVPWMAVNSCPGLWACREVTPGRSQLGVPSLARAELGARTAALPFPCILCLMNLLFPPVLLFSQHFYLQPPRGLLSLQNVLVCGTRVTRSRGCSTLHVLAAALNSCTLQPGQKGSVWCEMESSHGADLDTCSLCGRLLTSLFSCVIVLGSSAVCAGS